MAPESARLRSITAFLRQVLLRERGPGVAPFNPKAMLAIQIIGTLVAAGLLIVGLAAPHNRSIALLMGLAIAGGSTMLGFLFGLPKSGPADSYANADSTQEEGASTATTSVHRPRNASLEQVADWLTKVMLGAGLTQLETLKNLTLRLAEVIASCISPGDSTSPEAGTAFGLGMIGYFSSCGFLGGYLSTRLLLARLLMEEELNIDRLQEDARDAGRTEGVELGRHAALDASTQEINRRQIEKQMQASAADVTDPRMQAALEAAKQWRPSQPSTVKDDPQKGRFGGKPAANNRILSALVKSLADPQGELFEITLTVRSAGTPPLTEPVKFFLHASFKPDTVIVAPRDGVASLHLVSWGAFTVGAMTDGGGTTLELDLSKLPDAPEKFKSR